jgi:hypothetical protein
MKVGEGFSVNAKVLGRLLSVITKDDKGTKDSETLTTMGLTVNGD